MRTSIVWHKFHLLVNRA